MMSMEKKRVLFVIVLLVVATHLTFAAIATRPSFSIGYGGAFCHPTANYLKQYPGNPDVETPYFRTSGAFSLDVEALNVAYVFSDQNRTAIQLGFGFSYLSVSRSIAFGVSILKPYNGYGFHFDLDWRIVPVLDLHLRYRLFHCSFAGSSQRFLAHQFEVAPYYRFTTHKAIGFSVGLPVALIWRADSVSLQVSASFSVDIDSLLLRRSR